MNFEPEMIFVQGGTFMMGSPENEVGRYDDETQHEVTLSDFYIGKCPVTQAQWAAVMGDNPSHFKGDDLPVENVSWTDCQEFIQKLNMLTGKAYRLPTEAEWEYAARGGIYSNGYKYAGSDDLDEVAWRYKNSNLRTHSVGTKKPNELGIHDMSGNVWEWCQDWSGDYPSEPQPQINPTGPDSGGLRVLRGGSWSIDARRCRSADLGNFVPTIRAYYVGFRLALQ
jgi:formylglycine-generating enzyme required for sulfatase activity